MFMLLGRNVFLAAGISSNQLAGPSSEEMREAGAGNDGEGDTKIKMLNAKELSRVISNYKKCLLS